MRKSRQRWRHSYEAGGCIPHRRTVGGLGRAATRGTRTAGFEQTNQHYSAQTRSSIAEYNKQTTTSVASRRSERHRSTFRGRDRAAPGTRTARSCAAKQDENKITNATASTRSSFSSLADQDRETIMGLMIARENEHRSDSERAKRAGNGCAATKQTAGNTQTCRTCSPRLAPPAGPRARRCPRPRSPPVTGDKQHKKTISKIEGPKSLFAATH